MDRTTGDMIGHVGAMLAKGAYTVWATGFGKSACSARLFVEDLATLSVPAGFIHGGDLLHGGMGRITDMDALVIFSASGQGAELEKVASILDEREVTIAVVSVEHPKIFHHYLIQHGHGDTTYRFLNCPTIKQMEVARHLAETIAVERGIKSHHEIAWAHPANAKPTFVGAV